MPGTGLKVCVQCGGVRWGAVGCGGVRWGAVGWGAVGCGGIGCGGVGGCKPILVFSFGQAEQ